jgi:hypothetical protein
MNATSDVLQDLCREVRILPVRYLLRTSAKDFAIPLLRSVLGAVLHELDKRAYVTVFHRDQLSGQADDSQRFVLSGHEGGAEDAFTVDLTLIGEGIDSWESCESALVSGGQRGTGRRRNPFSIEGRCGLLPDATPVSDIVTWTLDEAVWPGGHSPSSFSCTLRFPGPLQLRVHEKSTLSDSTTRRMPITAPSFSNLFAAALGRISQYLSPAARKRVREREFRSQIVKESESIRHGIWRGGRCDDQCWSAGQDRLIRLDGVAGQLDLPDGAGEFWPAFAAARWLHLGRKTTYGLGAFDVV